MSTTQYMVGVTKNRFELFEIDDEDPLEVLKIHEQEKEARKKTKLSEKENKGKDPVTKIKPVPSRKGIKETQNLKPQENPKGKEDNKARVQRVDRGERKVNNENREERSNRRVREDRPSELNREERSDRPERKEFRGELRGERPSNNYVNAESSGTDGRGRGRGGRGGAFASRGTRGGRGGAGGSRSNFDSRGKREFDRQSGSDKTSHYSGIKPVDKREGSGAHNWGNHRDDIEDMRNSMSQPPEDSNTWTSEKNESEAVPEANGGVETEETNTSAQEEERRELTLDEWKALKAPRQKPTYNLRKAGEGEDPSQWKKMYALQKKKEGEEEDDEDDYEYESCDYPQRVGRQKHVLDIDIHFKDTRGGGRGRGGRGTGRGGPRMGMRGNSNPPATEKYVNPGRETVPKAAPKVDDEHDFPSLGQHLN